jgi:hypothetical protein
MATTRKSPPPPPRRLLQHPVVVGLVFLIGLAALLVWLLSLRRPPQMGTNEEAFRTVDALFTAINAHDEAGLAQCEARLHAYRDAGALPADSADYLDGIMEKARQGNWQTAAERLYDFMHAQQRDGPREPPPKRMKRGRK